MAISAFPWTPHGAESRINDRLPDYILILIFWQTGNRPGQHKNGQPRPSNMSRPLVPPGEFGGGRSSSTDNWFSKGLINQDNP
jgi:hypothetical protein